MSTAIDLFSGAGGFTEGAKAANTEVVWAANHWPLAVDVHSNNHPDTIHSCQDLQQADWWDIPDHDIALASPCCQGHSKARGKERYHHDRQRSTAMAIVSCAEVHREPVWVVENVVEFKRWVLYPVWLDAMFKLGYSVSEYIIDSADHGVPQNRIRLFLIFTLSNTPISLNLEKRDHQAIGQYIDWGYPKWSQVEKPKRSKATLNRIYNGRKELGSRFIAPYYGRGSGETGRSIDRPIGTITTIDRWSIIDGDRMRMFQPHEVKAAMGFKQEYKLPNNKRDAIKLLGNAVCPPVVTDLINEIKRVA